jgi:hypothetical protein
MKSEPQKNSNSWEPCNAGLIQSTAGSVSGEKAAIARREFLRNASVGAVVVAGAGIAGWSLFGDRNVRQANPAPIACSEVGLHLASFVDQSIDDEQLIKRIAHHLTKCSPCDRKHRQLVGSKTAQADCDHLDKSNP